LLPKLDCRSGSQNREQNFSSAKYPDPEVPCMEDSRGMFQVIRNQCLIGGGSRPLE
jgi:hypothetical protein